jgi:hypothetical protein
VAIDATVAGATSDSYLTVAEADALAASDLGPDVDEWHKAALDEKESALKLATIDIDADYGRPESPYIATQALRFPRTIDLLAGVPILLTALKRATWEQAKYRWANRQAIADARSRRAQGWSGKSDDDGSYTMSIRTDLERLSDRARFFLGSIASVRRSGIVSIPLRDATYS